MDKLLVRLHEIGLDELEMAFEADIGGVEPVDLRAVGGRIRAEGEAAVAELLDTWRFPGEDAAFRRLSLEAFAEAFRPGEGVNLMEGTARALFALVARETDLLITFADARRRAGGDWMAVTRAALARLQTGIRLDSGDAPAHVFSVSNNVYPDFLYAVTLIGDLKVGAFKDFYEAVATSYAIFAEYTFGRRFNTAAILAVDLDVAGGTVRSHQVRVVRTNDELRTRWVAQRDLALRTYAMPSEPPHPTDTVPCATCPYREFCWEGGVPGGVPIVNGTPANTGPPHGVTPA